MSFVGIDLGTSGLKAALIGSNGQVLASAHESMDTQSPQPGWSEQDPACWLAALDSVMRQLGASSHFSGVAGIAVAGHMHGAVVLGADDQPLRPCILWNDGRAERQAQRLDALDEFIDLTGNRVFAGFTAPKLLWLQENEPELFGKIRRVTLPASFLNLHLTGDAVIDCSDASGTAWLDVKQRKFSPELLAHTHLREEQMPRLIEGSEVAGTLRPELAARWGLSTGVVVAGGAADNAAAACGMGVHQQNDAFVSLGTSGVVLVGRDTFAPKPDTAVHTFCHALPQRWYQMSVMLSATDSLNWFAGLMGSSAPKLIQALGSQLQGPVNSQFFPYLSGERTPHNNTALRAGFVGLSGATDRAEMTQSVLTGITFGLADGLEALRAAGASPECLWAVGGGAQSDYWLEMLATVFGLPILKPVGGELGAALGAARLAQAATLGDTKSVFGMPGECRTIEPVAGLTDAYADAFGRFKELSRQSWLAQEFKPV